MPGPSQARRPAGAKVPVDDRSSDANGKLTSVVICTTGRSATLRDAISSVLHQSWLDLEVIVVDNRPETGQVRHLLRNESDRRLRYVPEPQHGLSNARNRGVRVARGQVLAFTDDDCVADRHWIRAIRDILDGYRHVDCVTGRTVAFGDSSELERQFEEFGSFDRGDERVVWRKPGLRPAGSDLPAPDGHHSRIYPFTGDYGSGNNMAFRASVFERNGLFDEALGAGTPSGGGEDLDMFIRLIRSGQVVVFEPGALVQHHHRADAAALRAQIRSYGSGLSAMVTKQLVTDISEGFDIVRRVGPGLSHFLRPSSEKNNRKSPDYPFRLTLVEWMGFLLGPWLYVRGRMAVRRRHQLARRRAVAGVQEG